jgi:hypothetical protein
VSRTGISPLFPIVIVAIVSGSCATRLAPLPSGPGTPFPDYTSAYAEATEACRGVRTLAAELALSGRAAGTKLRGRLLGGFAAPAQVRLEALFLGRPVFVFVASGENGTLVLNRDRRFLSGVPPEQIVEALAGIPLTPDELRSAVAGCGLGVTDASAGRLYPREWAVVEGLGSTNWLHRVDGNWQLVANARGTVEVRYDNFASGRPSTVRIRTGAAGDDAVTDLTIRLSQIDVNEPLGADVFQVEIPSEATPVTLEELRRAGPLGR